MWHRKGGYDVPVFVPSTPKSELATRIKHMEEVSGRNGQRCIRFRVVETGGVSLRQMLQRSNPWAGKKCGRDDCFPCTSGDKGGECGRSNVTYRIACVGCGEEGIASEYKGETGRTAYARGKEHLDDLAKKKACSPLWSHCQTDHESQQEEFKMEVTGMFKTSLPRQLTEGVQIHNFPGRLINRRSEWRLPGVARTEVSRNVRKE